MKEIITNVCSLGLGIIIGLGLTTKFEQPAEFIITVITIILISTIVTINRIGKF